MKINKMITPYNHAPGKVDRIRYIVIHYTGSLGSAQANCKYFMADGRKASAHYFVNHDGAVWQSVEDKDIAWHCTNKNPLCKNTNSIGIELCCRKDPTGRWYFEDATVAAAIELTRELMKKYKVPAENVWRHYDCTGKCCPDPFVKEPARWDAFKKALGASGKAPAPTPMATPTAVAKAPSAASDLGIPDGWAKHAGKWYYIRGGKLITDEWLHYKHHWYRLGSDGAMLTGWQMVPDSFGVPSACFFDETEADIGKMWHERDDGKGYLEVWTTED